MTSPSHLRKGWCPGALRPMRSGDGLLVRVRPRAGMFSIVALRAIAEIAMRFGSGEIDLTNRGNLQIRGVTDETFEGALAALGEAGLLGQSAEAEAVRNVVVDPLSGLDPSRAADIRDLAARLEDILGQDRRLWSLPGKFGFSFSGIASPRVGDKAADIMISAEGDRFAICLDGAEDSSTIASSDDVIEVTRLLAMAFVELAKNDASFRRMRDAVGRLGGTAIFTMAGLNAAVPSTERDVEKPMSAGVLTRGGGIFAVGVGLPFGRIVAAQLHALCDAAVDADASVVHASTGRILVFPVSDARAASQLLHSAKLAKLITEASDIRLAMDVCPGAPACRNASTDTRRDAQRFADTFSGSLGDRSVHVSGCEKGCARRSSASFTFVGRDGHYELILDGSAGAAQTNEIVRADGIAAAISRLMMEPAT